MRRILIAVILVCSCLKLIAQSQYHFIYFENSKKEWFTISVNNTLYESVGKDYIIVSKLVNGTYSFVINTQTAKETTISISIADEDKGYSIKQNNNNEVELFDLNTFTIIKAKENNRELLIEPSKQVTITDNKIDEPKTIPTQSTIKASIKKVFSKKTSDGLNEIYIDNEDTVSILIPVQPQETFTTPVEAKPESTKISTIKNSNADIATQPNMNCKVVADETDVKNLTIALQAQLKVKDRLNTAETWLKEKCYTTNQIKRLCSMFINSQGKLLFFRQSQKHTADLENFGSLEKELTDIAIIEEFREFVKQL